MNMTKLETLEQELSMVKAKIAALIDMKMVCASVVGGWQSKLKGTDEFWGPTFHNIQDLWKWQEETYNSWIRKEFDDGICKSTYKRMVSAMTEQSNEVTA
jgi:hypothetical protein